MTNTVTLPSVSQSFALANNSISTATAIATLCGPFEYSIVEAYSFLPVIAGTINLQSNLMTDIGTYTATLKAKLTNYAVVTPAQVALSVSLVNPCLTTILALPTVLVATSITSLSGSATLQVFAPATDTAATSAAVSDLCGPRVYTIVETTP